jgi:hypothetical protein
MENSGRRAWKKGGRRGICMEEIQGVNRVVTKLPPIRLLSVAGLGKKDNFLIASGNSFGGASSHRFSRGFTQ